MSDQTFEEDSLISQDDIDKLLKSSSIEEAEEKLSNDDTGSVDELGELSQDDIESLMNSNVSDLEDLTDESSDDEGVELISQEDINSLMAVDLAAPDPEGAPQEDDFVIDEAEAVDIQDSFIAQETIDDLIKNFDKGESSEPVILDDVQVSDPEAPPEPEKSFDPKDTEDFSAPEKEETALDFDGNEDISQEDIDLLLLEEIDDEEKDILISQDDIDTLLMAADQEDEDVLGDLAEDENEDEDILEFDSFDEDGGEDNHDPVVLVADAAQNEEPETKKKKAQWYKSKLLIASASVLIILGIIIPSAYFLFFSEKPGKESYPEPVAETGGETFREIGIETVEIKQPGNMILKDFIILAADLTKDLAYVTADISIDYSDQNAVYEIQNNLAFYRDLIYTSINKSLASDKIEKITEADILQIVETTLKSVLPGQYIDRISFKSFKAS